MEYVNIKINGKAVKAEKGMNLIQAAKQIGVKIPHFCYHKELSIAGNCRMCLVELENQPKLVPGCAIFVEEGMSILTNTEKVKQARASVLEFLLINHPLDCPICDQSGECKLQDYYMNYGKYDSRFIENKIKRAKAKIIGEHIILDQERCVLCTRCIRFCQEIIKDQQLGLFSRGDYAYIDIYDNKFLNTLYSGNLADICPVGALTDRDFRFKCRVWFLESTKSICPGCSRGCNIFIHHQQSKPYLWNGRRIFRIKPRFNPLINKSWICDLGRYGFTYVDDNRIRFPKKRQDSTFIKISWNEAYFEIAQIIKDIIKKDASKIGIILSPHLTNEDLYVAKTFFSLLGCKNISCDAVSTNTYEDDILIKREKFPNSKGAELLNISNGINDTKQILEKAKDGYFSCLYIVGQDLVKGYGEDYILEVLQRAKIKIMQLTNENATSKYADYILPASTFAEKKGTFVNFEGIIQLINKAFSPLEQSKADWEIFIELSKELELPLQFRSEEEIFKEIAGKYPNFENLTYEKIPEEGYKLKLVSKG